MMVGNDICTNVSQTEGYSEQISLLSKSSLVALGGSEGLLSCVPSLPLSPEVGRLHCLRVPGLQCRGDLQPWCDSPIASTPGATHQLPGLWGGDVEWEVNLGLVGRVGSWFAGSSQAHWGPMCQRCPGMRRCHLPQVLAVTRSPKLSLAMAATAKVGCQPESHAASTGGRHVEEAERRAGTGEKEEQKKQSE